jgi:hypothetical protein
MAGWHFVTLPEDISEDIKQHFGGIKRGWGSIPVKVSIDSVQWETSIFPDKKLNSYLLPIKADVRKKANVAADDLITLQIEVKK